MWYEFEYNKPYHHMNIQQRLRYEYEPEIDYEQFLNIDECFTKFDTDYKNELKNLCDAEMTV